jgi:hypothetical protein
MPHTVAAHRLQRLVSVSLVLVVALLPALAAGSQIDMPAAPGELERIAASLTEPPPSRVSSGLITCLADASLAAYDSLDAADLAIRLGTARLAQVAGIFALSLLVYLTVMLCRGRLQAWFTLAALCAMPAVTGYGYVLRHETTAVLFSWLSLLLLLGIPTLQSPEAARLQLSRAPVLLATGMTSGVAIAMSLAAMPTTGVALLLPGVAMLAVAVQLAVRLLRVLLRRLWVVVPLRAATRRLWPWVLPSISALVASALLLPLAVTVQGAAQPAVATGGLLPSAALLRWALALCIGLGFLSLLLRSGLAFGRGGRPGPDLLLLIHCSVLLGQRALRPTEEDALLAAAPAAVFLAEGVVAIARRILRRLRQL